MPGMDPIGHGRILSIRDYPGASQGLVYTDKPDIFQDVITPEPAWQQKASLQPAPASCCRRIAGCGRSGSRSLARIGRPDAAAHSWRALQASAMGCQPC